MNPYEYQAIPSGGPGVYPLLGVCCESNHKNKLQTCLPMLRTKFASRHILEMSIISHKCHLFHIKETMTYCIYYVLTFSVDIVCGVNIVKWGIYLGLFCFMFYNDSDSSFQLNSNSLLFIVCMSTQCCVYSPCIIWNTHFQQCSLFTGLLQSFNVGSWLCDAGKMVFPSVSSLYLKMEFHMTEQTPSAEASWFLDLTFIQFPSCPLACQPQPTLSSSAFYYWECVGLCLCFIYPKWACGACDRLLFS